MSEPAAEATSARPHDTAAVDTQVSAAASHVRLEPAPDIATQGGAAGGLPSTRPDVEQDDRVDGVLVAREGERWLPAALAALAASTHPLRRLVVVDLDGTAAPAIDAQPLPWPVERLALPSPGWVDDATAVAQGLAALAGADAARLVWLLRDDVAPEPDALAALVDAARAEPTAAVVGPKYVVPTDPGRLVEVGVTVSRAGRPLADPRYGQLDQGQHDHRHDVLAVSHGAVLVRRADLEALGGLDPAVGPAADVDLCWRAHQAGRRVVVAPAARVADERAAARGLRDDEPLPFAGHTLADLRERGYHHAVVARERRAWDRERRARARSVERRRRRSLRLVALARTPWWALPLRAVALLVGALVGAVGLLLAKRPRAARAELSDAGALLHPLALLRARRHGATVAHGDLRGLFASGREARRSLLDELYHALPHRPDEHAVAGLDGSPAEPGPVDDDAVDLPDPARTLHVGALVVGLATALAVAGWRSTFAGSPVEALLAGVAGGELPGTDGPAADLAAAHLVDPGRDTPWTLLVAGLARVLELLPGAHGDPRVGSAVLVLLLAAVPLSALTCWVASGAVTRRACPRAAVSLAWAFAPTLLLGLGAGRLGIAVEHVLTPLLLAGIAETARCRPAAWRVAATLLVAAVTIAFAPLLAVPTVVAGVVIALRGRRRPLGGRVAGASLALIPLLLQGPVVVRWLVEPWRLLVGPGLVDRSAVPAPWQLALGWPDAAPAVGPVPGAVVALGTTGIVVAGVLGLARCGRRDHARSRLAALLLAGLGIALLCPRLAVGQDWVDGSGAARDLVPWPGVPLDLYLGALLAVTLVATDRRTTRDLVGHGRRLASRAAVAAVAGGAAVPALVALVTTVAPTLLPARDPLPESARAQAASELATRSVVLQVDDDPAVVRYDLVGREPATPVRGLPDAGRDPSAYGAALSTALADAVDGTSRPDDGGAGARLHALGVGFVVLRGDLAPAATLAGHLDTTAGLARVSAAAVPTWRVLPRTAPDGAAVLPSRVRATADSVDLAALPLAGGGTDLPLPRGATAVVVAEPARAAAARRVRVGDETLTPRADDLGRARYALPEGATSVHVDPVHGSPWWTWGRLAVLVLLALVALPVGVRPRADEGLPR